MTSQLSQHTLSQSLRHTVTSVVISLSLCGAANAQTLQTGDLAPFEVEYEVGNNLISAGTATLKLVQEEDNWTYSLDTKPRGVFKLAGKGLISESSQFNVTDNGDSVQLQPHTYKFRQDDERRREVDATFDWSAKTITHMYRGTETTESFEEPVLDRLTVTLLIMNALRHDFTSAELPVYDTDKIKLVEFINDGMEELETPLGEMQTHRVINRNASGGSRETTTWFAPSLDYLPIKIEHRKRGELVARLSLIRVDNRVTSIELGEESIDAGGDDVKAATEATTETAAESTKTE